MAFQSLRVWRLCPILGETIKRAAGPPRSENSMPPRLKINFIPYANTPESLVPLSKIAQFRVFFSLTIALLLISTYFLMVLQENFMVQFSLLFQIFPANPRCKLRVYVTENPRSHETVNFEPRCSEGTLYWYDGNLIAK